MDKDTVYSYSPCILSHATCAERDGYLLFEIPAGTKLYHHSNKLPISISRSGKSILPDMPQEHSWFTSQGYGTHWGFSFPFRLTKPIAVLDLINRWNIVQLMKRSDIELDSKRALMGATGYGIDQIEMHPIAPYKSKPLTKLRFSGTLEYNMPVARWLCSHGFDGYALHSEFRPIGYSDRGPTNSVVEWLPVLLIGNPQAYIKPIRVNLSRLTVGEQANLFCKERPIDREDR